MLSSSAPANASEQAWAHRFQAEIRFISALLQTKVGGLPAALLDQALARLREQLSSPASQSTSRWAAAVQEAEAVLSPTVGPISQTFVIHLVGHAHIDMNWMWDWPETVRVTRDTFRTMDQIMGEDPEFRFSQSQASVYVAMQEFYPELFRRIVERQRRGQWEVTASTWVEPDANLPSGESWARQLLYTKRYFARTFGLPPEAVPVAWQPDTFGHPFTIPSILSGAGVPYLYYCRGGHLGPWWRLFWWEGPDGSRVLAFHDNDLWYNGPARPLDAALAALDLAKETGVTDYLFVYGVGDHGGGPTRHDLAVFHQAQQWPLFPKLIFSTAQQFFARVAATVAATVTAPTSAEPGTPNSELPAGQRVAGLPVPTLPVYRGELNTDLSGCYSSQARIKQQNRDCETALTRAETWRALSLVPNGHGDEALLEQAWQKHAFNQFHDILPGSGVPATYQYALGLGQQVRAAAEAVADRAYAQLLARHQASYPAPVVQALAQLKPSVVVARPSGQSETAPAQQPDPLSVGATSRGETANVDPNWVRPVAVANPLPWRQSDVLSLTIWDPPAGAEQAALIDPAGRVLLTQRLFRREEWGHQRLELLFPAMELPPLGLRSYAALLLTPAEWQRLVEEQGWQRQRSWHDFDPAIDPAGQPGGPGVQGWIDGVGQAHLENPMIAAIIEPGSGAVVHLIDKEKGIDLVPAGQRLGLLELNLESPHGASAWKIGPFAARQPLDRGATLRLEHRGPLEATAVVVHTHGDSRFELRISLSAISHRLEYHLSADWAERSGNDRPIPTLQVAFPIELGSSDDCAQTPELLYEIPFGTIRRPADGMEVPAQRFVTAGPLVVLNRGRYGFSASPQDGRSLVLLRMTLLRATHDPDPLPDQGRHEVEWAVMPVNPNIAHVASYAAQQASAYQYPAQAQALPAVPSAADLSWLELQPADGVAWSVLKNWEGVSATPDPSRETDWVIRLYEVNGRPQVVHLKFGAALLAQRGCPQAARELDLLERPVDEATLAARRAQALTATPGAPGQDPGAVPELRLDPDGVTIPLQGYEIKTILLHWD